MQSTNNNRRSYTIYIKDKAALPPYFFNTVRTYKKRKGLKILRIDKFLKNSRLIKRRTVAKEACEQERVTVNGKTAKPGTEVETGDIINIRFGTGEIKAKVVKLSESTKKEDASGMYEIIE